MRVPPPLQADSSCDPSIAGWEHLVRFEFMEAITCTYTVTAGFLIVGTLVYGAIGLSIYIRTGSPIIPTVLLFLAGGAVIAQAIAPVTAIGAVLILVTGAGVITYLYLRFTR